MYLRLLAFALLTLALPACADTLVGCVVSIADGDTIAVLDSSNKQHKIRLAGTEKHLGGWARPDSINEGKWKRFHPIPVLLPVQSYMEKDHERKSHWFDVLPDQAILGLLARHDDEARVYVVTVETPAEYHYIHDRWPRVVVFHSQELMQP